MISNPAVANAESANPISVAKPGSIIRSTTIARLSEFSAEDPRPSHSPTITNRAMVAARITLDSGPTKSTYPDIAIRAVKYLTFLGSPSPAQRKYMAPTMIARLAPETATR